MEKLLKITHTKSCYIFTSALKPAIKCFDGDLFLLGFDEIDFCFKEQTLSLISFFFSHESFEDWRNLPGVHASNN